MTGGERMGILIPDGCAIPSMIQNYFIDNVHIVFDYEN